MTADQWLMAVIAFGVWFFTTIFWIAYGTYRADQMRRSHAREVSFLKHEITTAAQMVARSEMQMRTLGSVPVSKLIGNETEGR